MIEPTIQDFKILLTLLEQCEVPSNAEQLNFAAASGALTRMRAYMDDQLLIHCEGQYHLSELGHLAIPRLKSLLHEISALKEITPELSPDIARQFKIAMPDHMTMLLLPPLMNAVSDALPNTSLLVDNSGLRMYGRLQFGEIDLSIELEPSKNTGFSHKPLFQWPLVCTMGKNNPLADEALSPENYSAAKHGLVAMSGNGMGSIDEALAQLGLTRNVVLIARQFSSVPMLAEQADMLFALPRPIAIKLAQHFPLINKEIPVSVSPLLYEGVWHSRHENDIEHSWFRRTVEVCCEKVSLMNVQADMPA